MHPLIAALALHHPHHATNAAAQAFQQYTTVTHHGSGEVLFWLAMAFLGLVAIVGMSRKRSRA